MDRSAPAACPGKGRRGKALLALGAAALLLVTVVFNRPLFLAINGSSSPPLDVLMLTASELGNALVAGLLVILLLPFRREKAVSALLAMALAGLAGSLVKELFPSPRPLAVLGEGVRSLGVPLRGNSFPSGHTATAFAAVFALRKAFPRPVTAALLVLASAVGLSRVYLGVHWPLDVAAGAVLGSLAALAAAGPLAPSARFLSRGGAATERVLLLLGAVCAWWAGWREPMLAHNFLVLRAFGVLGLAASAVLLLRSFLPGRAA